MSSRPCEGHCLCFDYRLGKVVDHNGAIHIDDRRVCAILFSYERSPAFRIQRISLFSAVPEIDATDGTAILRQEVVFPDEASHATIFRGSAQKDLTRFLESDRARQLEGGYGCDQLEPLFMVKGASWISLSISPLFFSRQ